MAESKHTPGPWQVDRSDGGTKVKDAGGNTVLWTQHTHLHGRRTDEEVMAIANIASAAPEMLETLRRVLPVLEATQRMLAAEAAKQGMEPDDTLLNAIRAAISKAEGRS